MRNKLFGFFVAVCLLGFGAHFAWGQDNIEHKIALLLSQNIRPYLEAVEGINLMLAESIHAEVSFFELEKIAGESDVILKERLSEGGYRLLIGIGPEAVELLETSMRALTVPKVYSMVLNPPESEPGFQQKCGISLNIPIEIQLERIREALPGMKRLGLLYDPLFNTPFFISADIYSRRTGVEIVPLPVSSKKEIPDILKSNWLNIDGVWLIPDQTVISESIVQYVIKQALYNQRPVIGYNRFFYDSGAAVAFVFDYEELGRQTARIALHLLQQGKCLEQPPVFHTWLNQRVVDRLGMESPKIINQEIEFGP